MRLKFFKHKNKLDINEICLYKIKIHLILVMEKDLLKLQCFNYLNEYSELFRFSFHGWFFDSKQLLSGVNVIGRKLLFSKTKI